MNTHMTYTKINVKLHKLANTLARCIKKVRCYKWRSHPTLNSKFACEIKINYTM